MLRLLDPLGDLPGGRGAVLQLPHDLLPQRPVELAVDLLPGVLVGLRRGLEARSGAVEAVGRPFWHRQQFAYHPFNAAHSRNSLRSSAMRAQVSASGSLAALPNPSSASRKAI